jgi:hypothetical protein
LLFEHSEGVQKMLKIQGIEEPAMPADERQKVFKGRSADLVFASHRHGLTPT